MTDIRTTHPTADKLAQVESLAKLFAGAKGVFLVDFTGLNSNRANELRRKIASGGGTYLVAKNTLAARAAKGTMVEGISQAFTGTTAIAVGGDDPSILAKALHAFQKENTEKFKFKGGVVEGVTFGAKDLEAVSNLPTKDQARAMLIGILQAPAAKLARLLNAPSTGLARCIDARGQQA